MPKERIHDPIKAEVMAYAGKEDRELAIELANVVIHYVTTGENTIKSVKEKEKPLYPIAYIRQGKLSTYDVLRSALSHNNSADAKENRVGWHYENDVVNTLADIKIAKEIKAGQTPHISDPRLC